MVWLANPPGEGGQTYYGQTTQWTTLYHWIAILDYDEMNDTIFVADGWKSGWYSIDEFSVYGITKIAYIDHN